MVIAVPKSGPCRLTAKRSYLFEAAGMLLTRVPKRKTMRPIPTLQQQWLAPHWQRAKGA